MFKDRKDAGIQLGHALHKYKNKHSMVLAIPRGGVEVAYQVAKALNASLSLIVVRKLPLPDDPEAGFGAIVEDGSTIILHNAYLSQIEMERISREQLLEIQRRIRVLRGGRPFPDIHGKTVILVDDGLAMGSTMRAAIEMCKNKKAGRIVVAVPVAAKSTANEIGALVDEIVVLEHPVPFYAVAQAYEHWHDVQDQEVIDLLSNVLRRRITV